MSKTRSLSVTQIEEVKAMVVQGVPPQKIANQFGVAVSTVHNYKNKFRNEGIEFASVRGRQSVNEQPNASVLIQNKNNQNNSPATRNNNQINAQNNNGSIEAGSTFIINGTTINITSEAKDVDIKKTDKGVVFKITI